MTARLQAAFALPSDYRPEDILSFHRRDPQELSEAVTADGLRKGMIWDDAPACLALRFEAGQAVAELEVDGALGEDAQARFEAMLRRMLGLCQAIAEFEDRYRDDPLVGRLVALQPGKRVPVTTTPFEALTWAVTGQQISVSAAVSLRRRLIAAVGVRHSAGLLCYPEAERLAELDDETLRAAGFSTTKAGTLLRLSRLVAEGRLALDAPEDPAQADDLRARLLDVKGVGPWTVDYVLLRGFGWLDGSLHGDVAVRRGLQRLLCTDEKIGEAQAREWLAQYSPWRALVAAHLWTLKADVAY